MSYAYPNAVLVICQDYETFKLAPNVFSTPFQNAVTNNAAQRVENMVKVAHTPLNYPGVTPYKHPFSLIDMVQAHKHIINMTGDPYYYVKDIENGMLKADANTRTKLFSVIFMLDGVFSNEQIKRVKARKIYFYENRGGQYASDYVKDHYCADPDDEFKVVGFAGSTVNLRDEITHIYKQFNLNI